MHSRVLRLVITSAVVFALAPTNAQAQYSRSITANPVELFSGTFNLEYETAVNPFLSMYGGINYLYFQGLSPSAIPDVTMVGPEFGLRGYLFGNAPTGLWVGPYLGLAYVHNRASSTPDTLGYGVGAMVGVNIALSRVNLSLGAGTGWVNYSSLVDGRRAGLYGVVPRVRLAAGFFF